MKRSRVAPGVYDRGTCWQVKIRRAGHTFTRSFPYDDTRADDEPSSKAGALSEANKCAAEQRHALRFAGVPASNLLAAQTLDGWIDRYLKDVAPTHRGAESERWALTAFRAQFPTLLADKVVNLTAEHFSVKAEASIAARMLKGGYSAATVRRRYVILNSLFETARRPSPDGWGFDEFKNPMKGVQWRKALADTARDRPLTVKEWPAIWQALAAVNPAARACIGFLRWTACRRGETLALAWSDIDWNTTPPTAALRAETTKTGKPRSVPLVPEAVAALRLVRGGRHWPETGPVFGSVRPASVSQAFDRAAARAGVKGVRLHDLRHTRLTEICRVLSIQRAMKVSGHTQPETLMRYYHEDAAGIGRLLLAAGRNAG